MKKEVFMRNFIKFFGIIIFITITAFSFIGCGGGDDTDKIDGDGIDGGGKESGGKDDDGPPTINDYNGYWTSTNGGYYIISVSEAKIRWSSGNYNLTSVVAASPNINELNKAEFQDGFVFTCSGGTKTFYLSANKDRFVESENSVIYTKRDSNVTVTFIIDAAHSHYANPSFTQTVAAGGRPTKPADPESTHDYRFDGWYTDAACTIKWNNNSDVFNNINIYSKFIYYYTAPLEKRLIWLKIEMNGNPTYEIIADELLPPTILDGNDFVFCNNFEIDTRSRIWITLKGNTGEEVISLSTSSGSLFTIGEDVTLILENITLQGIDDNYHKPLVVINNGGELIMNDGSKITGNTNYKFNDSYDYGGGGVFVDSGGRFTMNAGSEISGNINYSSNESSKGGGVYVNNSGQFIMNGGKISGNKASCSTKTIYPGNSYGGGVYVDSGGYFYMSGGEISGNGAHSEYSPYGGGVYVNSSGIFIMGGGEISGNRASCSSDRTAYGGGVYGTLTIYSGIIYGLNEINTSLSNISERYTSESTEYHWTYVNSSGAALTGYVTNHVELRGEFNDTIRIENGVIVQ